MKSFATLRNVLIAIPVLIFLVMLNYALPQVDVVRAVGVEIKRVDVTQDASGQQRTSDVYFLQMETPNGQPRVYRNEDNLPLVRTICEAAIRIHDAPFAAVPISLEEVVD